jgi:hypothetical protein
MTLNDELERTWMEVAMASCKVIRNIHMEGLRNTTETEKDYLNPSLDSNPGPPQYEGVLITECEFRL